MHIAILTFQGFNELASAWITRMEFMMPRFTDRFGDEAKGFDSAFLQCLASGDHRPRSRVWFILARAPDGIQDAG